MIVSKVKLLIPPKRRPQVQEIDRKLNISKLNEKDVVVDLDSDLQSKLVDLQLGCPPVEND